MSVVVQADSKPVKQEANGTVILPLSVFLELGLVLCVASPKAGAAIDAVEDACFRGKPRPCKLHFSKGLIYTQETNTSVMLFQGILNNFHFFSNVD